MLCATSTPSACSGHGHVESPSALPALSHPSLLAVLPNAAVLHRCEAALMAADLPSPAELRAQPLCSTSPRYSPLILNTIAWLLRLILSVFSLLWQNCLSLQQKCRLTKKTLIQNFCWLHRWNNPWCRAVQEGCSAQKQKETHLIKCWKKIPPKSVFYWGANVRTV